MDILGNIATKPLLNSSRCRICAWLAKPCSPAGPVTERRLPIRSPSGYWVLPNSFFVRWFWAWLLLILIYSLAPFGLSEVTAQQSRTLFYQWTAPLFDPALDDRAAVVLLTEDDLESGWPARYELHAELLRGVLEYQPRAVMVDIAFIDERPNDDTLTELAAVVEEYQEAGVPLYFGVLQRQGSSAQEKLIQGLSAVGAVTVTAPYGGGESRGVLYGLNSCNADSPPTAAQMMAGSSGECVSANKHARMHILWRLHAGGTSNGPFLCNRQSASVWTRMRARFTYFLGRSRSGGTAAQHQWDHIRETCPPQQTFVASDFITSISMQKHKAIQQHLANRMVLYGVYLDAVNDEIVPPTHTSIPGVYFHAMAAENLRAPPGQGALYQHPMVSARWFFPGILELFSLFILVGMRDYAHYCIRGVDLRADGRYSRDWLRKGLWSREVLHRFAFWLAVEVLLVVVSLTVIVVITCIGVFYFRSPPIDFIGLVGLVVIRTVPGIIVWLDGVRRNICRPVPAGGV